MCAYNPRKWPETDVFAKTHLHTFLARRYTPGATMHLTMVGTGRRDRQSDEMLILASVWASNWRFQRHLKWPEKARNVYPTVKNQWKPRQMSPRRSQCTSGMLLKNWPEYWKLCTYNPWKWPESDVFAKTHLQTLLSHRHTPVAVMH
jgi:hypothetical protein